MRSKKGNNANSDLDSEASTAGHSDLELLQSLMDRDLEGTSSWHNAVCKSSEQD